MCMCMCMCMSPLYRSAKHDRCVSVVLGGVVRDVAEDHLRFAVGVHRRLVVVVDDLASSVPVAAAVAIRQAHRLDHQLACALGFVVLRPPGFIGGVLGHGHLWYGPRWQSCARGDANCAEQRRPLEQEAEGGHG